MEHLCLVIRRILLWSETFEWLPYDEERQQFFMYGFIRNIQNTVTVSDHMFEMFLYMLFFGETN